MFVLSRTIVGEPEQTFALEEAAADNPRARIAFYKRRDRARTVKKI
jgi:hypothetical protein